MPPSRWRLTTATVSAWHDAAELRRIRTGGTRGHAPRVEKDSHGVADGACLEGVSVGRPKLWHPFGHGGTVSPRPCPSISCSRGNMASAAAPDGARRQSVPLFSSRRPCAYRSSSADRLLDSLAVRCRSLLDEDGVLRELLGRRSGVIRDEPRPEHDRIDAPPRVVCRPIHAGPRVAKTRFLKHAAARRPAKFGANTSQDWRRRGLVPGNAGAAKARVGAAFVLARWSCSEPAEPSPPHEMVLWGSPNLFERTSGCSCKSACRARCRNESSS